MLYFVRSFLQIFETHENVHGNVSKSLSYFLDGENCHPAAQSIPRAELTVTQSDMVRWSLHCLALCFLCKELNVDFM